MITSSGDLRADRRLDYALRIKAEGDLEGAISLIEQALEIAPDWEAAHFALAEALEAAGRRKDAAQHYLAHLSHVRGDARGAALKLALLGAAEVPEKAPEAYVRALFDEYAPRFDEALVEHLGYRVPGLLREAVDRLRPPQRTGERVLDLGCGTGLAGQAFRDRASWLEGVDLSPAMVAQARRKRTYDALVVAEIEAHLAAVEAPFDLVVAADVLIYFGALDGVLRATRRVLRKGGLLAFTTQALEGDGYVLGRDQRYAHAKPYLIRAGSDAGFGAISIAEVTLRKEAGRDVPGFLCILT